MKKTASVISLGCLRNTYDSEVILKEFEKKGYRAQRFAERVDTLIINTCGFIADAKKESIAAIQEAVTLKVKGRVRNLVVVGCLIERYRAQLEKYYPEVDEWKGVIDFPRNQQERIRIYPSHIGLLKVCEGCMNKCSYCAVPIIKGPLVSRHADEIVKEARRLQREGAKELVILGQDITAYGNESRGRESLLTLLEKILESTSVPWIRLLYTHPRHFSSGLINLIAREPRICNYIDLPIQHINDRILKAMNRRTSKRDIISLIDRIRSAAPGIALRTSVMVGFPGETEEIFEELLAFVEKTRFERLGVFTYSREEGTGAYHLKHQVHHATKRRRYNILMRTQQDISRRYNESFKGKNLKVLIDENRGSDAIGRSQLSAYDIDGVVFVNRGDATPGRFYTVTVVDTLEYDLIAQ